MRPPVPVRMVMMAEFLANWFSTCNINHGSVLFDGPEIYSLGYNGAPSGEPHCIDVGCLMERGHCVRAVHSETNTLGYAEERGIETDGKNMAVTASPCPDCQNLIDKKGIDTVYYRYDYRGVVPDSDEVNYVKVGWGNLN